MRRRNIIVAAAAMTLVAGVGNAAGATVTTGGGEVRLSAPAGETNDVSVAKVGTNYVLTDLGAPLTAGAGCAPVTANSASCPDVGVQTINVFLNDGNDKALVADSVAGVSVQLDGSSGNDTLIGGQKTDDALVGDGSVAGNDMLTGRSGNDRLFGGPGADTMDGGDGNDSFSGDEGNDTIVGGAGDDTYTVQVGPDGADSISLGAGNDRLDWRNRNAPLNLSADWVADDGQAGEGDNIGRDVEDISGGQGPDTIVVSQLAILSNVDGDNGNDLITGGPGNDSLRGGNGDDVIAGRDGNDSIVGNTGIDSIDAGPGDDEIRSFFGDVEPDVYVGGTGTDRVNYQSASAPLTVTLDGVANDGVVGENDNVGTDIEDLLGSSFADTFTGNAAANQFDGGPGNDVLNGAGGSDGLTGGRGDDTLAGGSGIDALDGGDGADRLVSRDEAADDVACGGSNDVALIDALDLARACETTSRGVAIITTNARAKAGRVAVTLSCPAAEAAPCRGSLRLVRGAQLGIRSFTIAAGGRAVVRVPLNATGRRAIARQSSVRVTALATFVDATTTSVTTRTALTVRR